MMKCIIILLFGLFTLNTLGAQNVDSLITLTIKNAEIFRKQDKNYTKAIEILQSSLKELKKNGVTDSILVALYHKIGINHAYRSDYKKAEVYISKALNIRLKTLGLIHFDVVRSYHARLSIYMKDYKYKAAQKDINQAVYAMESLISQKKSRDTSRLIRIYNDYIRLNTKLKNNASALEYWEKSYNFYRKNKKKYAAKIASLFAKKGEILINQKKYNLAEESYLKTVEIYAKIYLENNRYKQNLAGAYQDLAWVQTKLNLYENSLANYLKAISLFQELINKKNNLKLQQDLGNIYCNLVELQNTTNQFNIAEVYFQKSHQHNLAGFSSPYHPRFAELYRNKTQTNINQKKHPEALQFNQKSLQALLPTLKTTNPLQLVNLNQHPIKDKISFLETLQQKAEVFTLIYNQAGKKDLKYLQAAFQNYQTLDTVITQIRQGYAQGSQFELIEQSYPIYEKAIAAGIQLFEKTGKREYLEAAYYFTAKNKALVLLGGMQEEKAKSLSSIPANLLVDEKALKQAIFQLESKLYEQADTENKIQLQDSLFTLRRAHQKLIHRFEKEHTDYFNAKYGFDKRIEISALQEKIAKNTAIIEYFVGDKQLFIFTITKTSFDYVAMEKPTGFEENALSFREKIESQAALQDEFLKQSHQLYQWLLAGPLGRANKNGNINHLIIIPDGILMQLPFDVFLQEGTGRNYILRDYAVSYAYSNQLLFAKSKHKKAKHLFAGFGLEYDDYTLANLETYVDNPLASLPLSRALGKLQYSDDEIIEISNLLNGDKWLNEAATREAFLENAGQYAILHLATHGIVNEEYPMNSALIFTRQNDSTAYFLRAADLYNMDLNADMAVLSACNTGAGTLQRGEGVRSLARAFSYAGCPSLIASLWSASDKSTKDILVDFYKNLKTGMTKDEAMRQAKLTYLDNAPPAYQSPYYWSHLSVIGDSSELEVLRSTPSWKKYAIGGVMSLLIIGIWGYRKRKMAA